MGDRSYDIVYHEPESIEEAITRKNALGVDILNIQAQLGNRDQTINGQRMESIDYWQWRKRAMTALHSKMEELRRLKDYLARHSGKQGRNHERSLLLMRSLRALLAGAGEDERRALIYMIDMYLEEAK